MTSTIPSAPVSTKQQASGRAIVRSIHGQYELMLWVAAGGLSAPLSIGSCKSGTYQPTVRQTGIVAHGGMGPAFVLMPSGTSGYLVWVNTTQEIMISRAVATPAATAKSPPEWSLTGNILMIERSRAEAGPAAMLQMQNGEPVVTIVWQDVNAGSMVYAQVAPGMLEDQTQPAFDKLGDSCKDAPCLARLGGASVLAYFDGSGAFTLAVDPAGGVDFDFDRRFTTSAISSVWGPAFVPLGRTLGYVFWSTPQGLSYQQIGINSDGDWQLNGRQGCSGSFPKLYAGAAPSAQAVEVIAKNGQAGKGILLAAPSGNSKPVGTVMVAGIVPDLSPLPLPQLQLVTS